MRLLLGFPKMDGLTVCTIPATKAASFSGSPMSFPSCSSGIRIRGKREDFCTKKGRFSVFSSKNEEPKLNEWDQMELKFGRLLGEDPKLTLAKITARKLNPDASFVEVEKSFYKNKGKIAEIEEVPLDWSKEKKPSNSLDGLNLVRPIPKKGTKFETHGKEAKPKIKKMITSLQKPLDDATKTRVPNVILRKPSPYYEEDAEDKISKLRLKPNLSLKMRNEQSKEKFSDMTLLRKPEPMNPDMGLEKKEITSSGNLEDGITCDSVGFNIEQEEGEAGGYVDFTLLEKPEVDSKLEEKQEEAAVMEEEVTIPVTDATNADATEKESTSEMQLFNQSTLGCANEKTATEDLTDKTLDNSDLQVAAEATLQRKPHRLDQSITDASTSSREEDVLVNYEDHGSSADLRRPPSRPSLEERDWNKVEDLLKREARADVELISSSTRGFAVSYGSLTGFLPYRNLAAKWKFLAFESWLRRKGVEPSVYRQNLGVIGTHDVTNKNATPDSIDSEADKIIEGEISSDMKLEDLLMIYDKEKQKYLSSFVGQKIKVNVLMADRNSRKLIFSMRPREKEEAVEKKRSLMARLRIGDVVKCCIKKITYFGIFVEVEGVPALIHQTEVSWDATLDPASYFKIGQIVEAKVHQLDFALERIFLSLKGMTPDPLTEALEPVVSDHSQFGGRLQAAEADSEWEDVELLIKELEKIEGIQSVSKGCFFLSVGLAPTFQVYMASMFENQYKLLARSGNKVQELIVEASLSKEEMKSTILSCTNRVV